MIIPSPQLSAHLKHQLGQGYVIIGDDPFSMDDIHSQILAAWSAKIGAAHGWDKKTIWIEESGDWAKLYTQTNHFSLFSTALLLDARFHKKNLDTKGKTWLTQYTQASDSPAFLILQAPFLQPKQLSLLQKHRHVHLIEIKPIKGKAVLSFIESRLQKSGIRFEREVVGFIADYTEGNILATHQCLEQLGLLASTSSLLTLDTLRSYLSDTAIFPLYALSETCLEGKPERIVRILQNLKQTETEPLLILWWLTKITRQVYALLIGVQQHTPLATLYSSLGIWSSQQSLYQQAMKRLSIAQLSQMLMACHKIDIAIKSNATLPIWETLEQVALSFYHATFPLSPEFIDYD